MTQTPAADSSGIAAHGEFTDHGVPHGSTSLTPFLVIPDARGAIAFYRDVFGARVVDVTEIAGAVAHAVLDFGHGQLQLGEPAPGYHLIPKPDGEDDCYSIGLYCADVDAVLARAEAAGATVREPRFVELDFGCRDRTATRRLCKTWFEESRSLATSSNSTPMSAIPSDSESTRPNPQADFFLRDNDARRAIELLFGEPIAPEVNSGRTAWSRPGTAVGRPGCLRAACCRSRAYGPNDR